MSTPGSNLLTQAFRLIKPTYVEYLKASGRTLNEARQWVPSFAAAETIRMSVQAVPRSKYIMYGLEFQKDYVKVWCEKDMVDLQRDTSGDRIVWNKQVYQLTSQTDWFLQDGWSSCMAVRIGKATAP